MTFLELLDQSKEFAIGLSIVLGLMIGSFLNVVIYRVPLMLMSQWQMELDLAAGKEVEPPSRFNLLWPPSSCTSCSHVLSWYHNVPVISWLVLRAKCGFCQVKISPRYICVEIMTAVLSGLAVSHWGASINSLGALFFIWTLIALAWIDADTKLLPDTMTLGLLWLGFLFNWNGHGFASLQDAVLGAFLGYSVLWVVFQAFRLITGKDGMGFGDFKLLAAIGAWLGWQMLLPVILGSSLLGAVLGILILRLKRYDKTTALPFGPYLALAGVVALFYRIPLMHFFYG